MRAAHSTLEESINNLIKDLNNIDEDPIVPLTT